MQEDKRCVSFRLAVVWPYERSIAPILLGRESICAKAQAFKRKCIIQCNDERRLSIIRYRSSYHPRKRKRARRAKREIREWPNKLDCPLFPRGSTPRRIPWRATISRSFLRHGRCDRFADGRCVYVFLSVALRLWNYTCSSFEPTSNNIYLSR